MLDAIYQFVGLLDVHGNMLEINRAALEAVGICMDDIRGKPFWEARRWDISGGTRKMPREWILRASQGEFVRCDFEVYGQSMGEETIIVDFSLLPIKDSDGNVVFLLPEGRNITEKKRAEEATARKNEELRASGELIRRQRDELQELYDRIVSEQNLSERLLLNLLPYPIAERLKTRADLIANTIPEIIADSCPAVTVLFADIVAFSRFSAGMSPEQLVTILNEVFAEFDTIADDRGLEKIKTIGDAYMAAAGLPKPAEDHAIRAAHMALDMIRALELFNQRRGFELQSMQDRSVLTAGFDTDHDGLVVRVNDRAWPHAGPRAYRHIADEGCLWRDMRVAVNGQNDFAKPVNRYEVLIFGIREVTATAKIPQMPSSCRTGVGHNTRPSGRG